jgi:hypothetical protein
MKEVVCLNCNSIIAIKGEPHLGQQLECDNCSAELEVIHLFPIELDWVLEKDDDDDDYDDYDDYDDDELDDDDFDDEYEEEYDEERAEA